MVKAQGAGDAQARFRRVMWPVIRRYWDFDLSGYERLPAEGPAILCPNHVSFIDSVFLCCSVPRNISFVGKAEYMDSWKTKYIFPMLGMIPIDRTGGPRARAALDTAARVLRRGELFGIYPRAHARDGKLHKGRTGAARLTMNRRADLSGRDRRHRHDPPPDSCGPPRKIQDLHRPAGPPERYAQMPRAITGRTGR